VFAREVVPLLQRRGLFRQEYGGETLRAHYGLPRPDEWFRETSSSHRQASI